LLSKAEETMVFFSEDSAHDVIPEKWMSGMANEKYMRISRLRNEKDRRLAILTHRLLCYALYTQFGIMPTADDWASGWHGKPYLKNAPHVHFNLSHSGSIAMCALNSTPVGADIEKIGDADSITARRILSEQELTAFDTAQDKNSMFYKIWTLKEAYIKFNGRGLGGDLRALTVYPQGDHITTSISGCRFVLIDPAPGYQAAMCASDVRHHVNWVSAKSLDQF
jgi:4'-phosphopantetheinyl transferase